MHSSSNDLTSEGTNIKPIELLVESIEVKSGTNELCIHTSNSYIFCHYKKLYF